MTKLKTNQVEVPRKFNFFTDVLKAAGGDDEPMTLSGVASSTVEDLHGDKIERTALKDMEAAVSKGLTIFLNHSYNVPEDVAGFSESARVKKRGTDAEGNGVWDLDIDITINDENPRAIEAWKGIKGGKWKAGLSIGANIPEDGFEYDRNTGKFTINHINLLETSIVGIPANQRSWIAKALEVLVPEVEESDEPEVIRDDEILEAVKNATTDAPPADDRDEEPEVQESGEPDGDDTVEYHEGEPAGEPDKQDDATPDADPATPVVEESDSADPSTVETVDEDGDPAPEAMLASLTEVEGEVTLTHLQSAVQVGVKLAERIKTLEGERDAAIAAKAAAETDRNQAIRYAAEAITVAKEVGALPVGRKADKAKISDKAASVARRFSDIYPPDFIKMLEK